MSRAQGVKALRAEAREWFEIARQIAEGEREWMMTPEPSDAAWIRYVAHYRLPGHLGSALDNDVRVLRALFLSLECADEANALAKSATRGGAA